MKTKKVNNNIYYTTTPQEFRECRALLTGAGYTQVTNAVLPNHLTGDNFIQVDHRCALFALTTQARADKAGYINYFNYIKNLKK